ncbi:hypothetical protein RB653_008976 [Dictyostelium firmibasis]|uniref:Dolichyl-diphosphooligosaccharide--protein glycosyltransferase subunit 2 n=1 Tax=Dictyostelium firmibasis TaxID=79012 RepID=A0AAN7U172_9MYCE
MKLIILIVLSILISIVISGAAQSKITTTRGISNVYSKNDVNNIKQFISSKYNANTKLYGESLKDTFYGVGVLTRIGETVESSKDICKQTKEQLKQNKNTDIELVFNGVSILSELKCLQGESLGNEQQLQELLKNKLESGSLLEKTQAINIYFTLSTAKAIDSKTVSAIDPLLQQAVSSIVSLMDEDGTFKSVGSDDEGNLQNTAAAYFALARLSHRLKSNEVDKLVAKVVNKVDTVIASADETTDSLHFNDLSTTSSLLHGLLSLASVNDKVSETIGNKQINQISEYLLKQKNVESLSDAYHLIVGLKRCQKNSISQPISLSLVKSIYSPSGLNDIRVSVTDIFGQPIESSVLVNKVVSSKSPRSTPILSGKEMKFQPSDNTFAIDVSNENLKLGSYNFEFKVQPVDTENFKSITNTQIITVTGAVTVNDMKLSYAPKADQLGSQKSTSEVQFGQKLSLVEIPSNNVARIFFRIASEGQPYQAQQVGIRFHSPAREAVVPATFSADAYSYTFTNKDVCKILGCQSGNYQLDLIIGDQSITPLQWNFGEINLKFNQTTVPTNRYPEQLPISHNFRQAEKRPPQSVSSLFTILVLSPIAIFVFGLLFVGTNLGRFPTGMGFIYTMAFIGCIASTGLLIANYWLQSTMDVTLKNLALLMIPLIFFGHKSMSYYSNLSSSNIKKD